MKWQGRRCWIRAVSAYTLAGLSSSMAVGWLTGWLGGWFHLKSLSFWILPVSVVAIATREVGWLRFPIPERRVQTESAWFHLYGPLQTAAMWGFHLGLGVATRITYMGYWVLVLAVVTLGSGMFGALTMGCYWLGRALPVWIAPVLTDHEDGKAGLRLMCDAVARQSLFRLLHLVSVVWLGCIGLLMAIRS